MTTISFDLVSPEKFLFNDEVGMIIVPGKDGDIGVLPGHSKVLLSLRPGRIMVYGEDKILLNSFFVVGGFAEINPEKCIILAEGVDEIKNLDKSSIENIIQKMGDQDSEEEKFKLLIAKSKIEALNSSYYEKL